MPSSRLSFIVFSTPIILITNVLPANGDDHKCQEYCNANCSSYFHFELGHDNSQFRDCVKVKVNIYICNCAQISKSTIAESSTTTVPTPIIAIVIVAVIIGLAFIYQCCRRMNSFYGGNVGLTNSPIVPTSSYYTTSNVMAINGVTSHVPGESQQSVQPSFNPAFYVDLNAPSLYAINNPEVVQALSYQCEAPPPTYSEVTAGIS